MADETTDNPTDVQTPTEANADAGEMATEALDSAEQAVASLKEEADDDAGGAVDLPDFEQVLAAVEAGGIDMLGDVELDVKIELGRTHMLVEDVLKLGEGSVVELDKVAGDPVDVYVNNRLIARGEVLVLSDNFCVRISEVVAGTEELNRVAEEAKEEEAAGASETRAAETSGAAR